MIFLETDRLILRELNPNDAQFIFEIVNDPSFIENIGDRGVRTLTDAVGYISRIEESYQKNGYGLLVCELKSSPTPVGMCGLVRRDTLPEADLGFAFLPAYWRQGYAVESSQAVLAFAKKRLGLSSLLAITSPENNGSIRTLEKLGFQFERILELNPNDPVKVFSLSL